MLSDEDEESMLEFLQANTFLYNMKSKDYKDNVLLRAHVWQTQADEMGLDGNFFFQLSLMYNYVIIIHVNYDILKCKQCRDLSQYNIYGVFIFCVFSWDNCAVVYIYPDQICQVGQQEVWWWCGAWDWIDW